MRPARWLSFLILMPFCLACRGGADARKIYWDRKIAAELPAGTELSRVDDFFHREHTEVSFSSKEGILYAIERNVSGSALVSWDIAIRCQFDSGMRLRSCETSKVGTGP